MIANNNQKIIRQSRNIWPKISKPNSDKPGNPKNRRDSVRVTPRFAANYRLSATTPSSIVFTAGKNL